MAPKSSAKAVVVEDEAELFATAYREVEKNEDIQVAELMAALGGQLVWAVGGKIAQSSVKRALQDAKQKHADIQQELEAEPEPVREPTQLALQSAGPNAQGFDMFAVCAVECQVKHPESCVVAVRHPTEFIIEAFDGTGTARPEGGDTFFVAIRGAQRVRARVQDNGDRTYQCVWTPLQSGTYNVRGSPPPRRRRRRRRRHARSPGCAPPPRRLRPRPRAPPCALRRSLARSSPVSCRRRI